MSTPLPSLLPPSPSSVPGRHSFLILPRSCATSTSHLPMDGGAATVCSMCGDIGFPDKLFRCARCRYRFQHSYCTNYYGDGAPASAGADMCDWCLGDVSGKARRSASTSGKQQASVCQDSATTGYSGRIDKAATGGDQESGRRGSTKVGGRRYKLLKDVLC
ncbi:uncharacterized protein LOC125533871 [Triticum urartu]|uniref:uncharacterized protein LOC125533870 n=1 Tax=Triticum urartu TaxID=4572 RepID=UPI0020440C06|nr:uncharacterized protein LOC125533870 [Triticum urartu]XP_048553158.1 uncharacterized protein LOC125533871 [Triticum urartu]